MISQEELNKIYAEKLLATGSHDAAILKVCWVAYNQGRQDEKEGQSQKETEK